MIDQTILPGGGSHVPGYSAGTAEGLWEGVWCVSQNHKNAPLPVLLILLAFC